MRLVIVTETFLPKMDGIVRTLLHLLEHLAGGGHDALVVAAGSGPDRVRGFPIQRVAGVRFPLYPELTLAPIAPRLGRVLDEFQPDVVHLAGPAVLGAAGLVAARRRRLPTAAHFQTDIPAYAGYFGYPWLTPMLWRYLLALHNRCDANYAPTPRLRGALQARGMRNVRVSARGVDSDAFSPMHRNGKRTDLLYVGRVSPEKNVDWLADLAEAMPDRTVRIVGDGPGLPGLRRRLGGWPNVAISGALYGQDLAEAYASAKLFVFPSHTETFGQTVQEAMASGLPVIGIRAGGVADLVQPGHTGLLAEPDDREGFIGAVHRLLRDTQSRDRMAVEARRFAEARTWTAVFDSLLDDYLQLISDKRSIHGKS